MPSFRSAFSLITLASHASAWGSLGHNTVAYIAQSFLAPSTIQYTQTLLNDTSSAYLANVATWADSYRSQPGGAFSAPYHYIDALDSPPTSCNVDYERDCPEEGCIVSAIANYTKRFQDEAIGLVERQKALKWVVHFLGDVHQPLHVENLAVGGNTINVTFANSSTNLHRVWDTSIPEKFVGGFDMDDARDWANSLIDEIRGGKYANATASWLQGIVANDSIASSMHWAIDSNAYVCSTVVPEGEEGVEGQELSGGYYDSAIPVVQVQIAKAGYRLAAWLNLIITGSVGVGGNGTGYQVSGEKRGLVRRGSRDLEQWMVEARRVRRAYGWDCGHEH
jgi:hypothetical protein